MTLVRAYQRRVPFLQRRLLSRTGSGAGGNGGVGPDCNIVADTDNVRQDTDNVIAAVCESFTVLVDADVVCVDADVVIIGF